MTVSPPSYSVASAVLVMDTSATGVTVVVTWSWLLAGAVSGVVVVTSAALVAALVRAGSTWTVTCTVRVAPGASVP